MNKRTMSFSAKQRINTIKTEDLFLEINEEEHKSLQYALLDMYKDIASVCKKYNIIPYLAGGSALGAVRHQGFIPWDDDLDVLMLRSDYEKFRKVFRKELSDRYLLNAPNSSRNPKARFPKVIKKGTVLREILDVNDPERNGLFIDIFLIENIPVHILQRKLKGAVCNGLEYISGQVFMKENMTDDARIMYLRAGKRSYIINNMVGTMFSVIPSKNWFHAVDKAVYYKQKTGYYGFPTGRKHYFGEIFKEEDLFPAKYIDFEDIQAPVFHNYDKYLRNLYGDYMQIPKEEDRERHYIVELEL